MSHGGPEINSDGVHLPYAKARRSRVCLPESFSEGSSHRPPASGSDSSVSFIAASIAALFTSTNSQTMDDNGDLRFIAWKDTCLFHNLVKNIKGARDFVAQNESGADLESGEENLPGLLKLLSTPVVFKGKVKLHGSNAGVALAAGKIRAQSRTQFIDQSGFGRIVFGKNEVYWRSLVEPGGPERFTIYGEYCGKGVQSGVALAQLPGVIFAVFGIDVDGRLIIDPEDITHFMTKAGTVKLPEDVFVLPWHATEFHIDLSNDTPEHMELIQKVLDSIEEEVLKIDASDPWVESIFGVRGPGEGLVLYPVSLMDSHATVPQYRTLDRELFGKVAFKAKGEKHRVVKAAKSVTVNPEQAASAEAFAKLMCPTARLEQGAGVVGYDMAHIKDFLAWMMADVKKEGQAELDASGLDWKAVTQPITKHCSAWYVKEVKARAPAK